MEPCLQPVLVLVGIDFRDQDYQGNQRDNAETGQPQQGFEQCLQQTHGSGTTIEDKSLFAGERVQVIARFGNGCAYPGGCGPARMIPRRDGALQRQEVVNISVNPLMELLQLRQF